MKIIYNSLIPFRGFAAVNLFGVLFARRECEGRLGAETLRHEGIHTAQMRELLWLPFYALYLLEWLARLPFGGAYRRVSFEREAYSRQHDPAYLKARKPYAMWRKKNPLSHSAH